MASVFEDIFSAEETEDDDKTFSQTETFMKQVRKKLGETGHTDKLIDEMFSRSPAQEAARLRGEVDESPKFSVTSAMLYDLMQTLEVDPLELRPERAQAALVLIATYIEEGKKLFWTPYEK